jgi:hypothetical protein
LALVGRRTTARGRLPGEVACRGGLGGWVGRMADRDARCVTGCTDLTFGRQADKCGGVSVRRVAQAAMPSLVRGWTDRNSSARAIQR